MPASRLMPVIHRRRHRRRHHRCHPRRCLYRSPDGVLIVVLADCCVCVFFLIVDCPSLLVDCCLYVNATVFVILATAAAAATAAVVVVVIAIVVSSGITASFPSLAWSSPSVVSLPSVTL